MIQLFDPFQLVLTIVGSIAVFNSFFYGAIFLLRRKRNLPGNLLAGLSIAVSLRIFKSIVAFSIGHVNDWIPAIGLVGMSLLGPFLFLYVLSRQTDRKWQRTDYLHFVFSGLVAITLIINNLRIFENAYLLSSLQMMTYVVLCFKIVRGYKTLDPWLNWLMAMIAIIAMTFLFQLTVPSIMNYVIATSIASLALHFAIIKGFQHRKKLFKSNSTVSRGDEEQIINRLNYLLEEQKVFRQLDIDLNKLASMMDVQPYVLSRVVNTIFGKTVPRLLNEHRVNDVKNYLMDPKNNDKIESLAFQSGFKSPTIFYRTFKDFTNYSPTEFRKQHGI